MSNDYRLHNGNCLQVMADMLSNSVDSIVTDPFLGSGSTGKAAMLEGFRFIGIELEKSYIEIAKARIDFALIAKEQDVLFPKDFTIEKMKPAADLYEQEQLNA